MLKNFILGPFLGPESSKQSYSPKIKICVNFKSLCGCSFIRFRALFQKAWFASILGLYAAVTSCKNQKKLNELTFDNAGKTSFWATFGLKPPKKASPPPPSRPPPPKKKRSIGSTWRIYFAVTSNKKSGEFHTSIFRKTWISHFGPIIGPFGPQNPRTRFFKKIRFSQFLS